MSEAGILHHFKSKDALLIAVLEYRDELTQAVAFVTPESTGIEFVAGWFELVKFNLSTPGIVELYCIVSAEATSKDHPAHDFFKERYDYIIFMVTRFIRKLETEGYLLPNLDPASIGQTLIALSDGLQVQWLLNRERDILAEHRNFFKSRLNADGLKALGI